MVRTKRIFLLHFLPRCVLLAAVPAIVLGLVFHAVGSSRGKAAVFPNGARLNLLGESRRGQEFTTDNFVSARDDQARLFPPDKVGHFGARPDSLAIWFTLAGTNGADLPQHPWVWYAAVAQDGTRLSVLRQQDSYEKRPFEDRWLGLRRDIHRLWLDTFPRRQAQFELQFLDTNGQSVASILLDNPLRGRPFPEWAPERMPVTRTNGPLKVTLASVAVQTNVLPPYAARLLPTWSLETSDSNWRGASPDFVECEDATGNSTRGLSDINDTGSLLPDPREKAWKLKLWFRRPEPTNHPESEKLVLPLGMPAPGTLTTNAFELQGLKFSMLLAGVGGFTNGPIVGERIGAKSNSYPFLAIHASDVGVRDEINFRVSSPDGRMGIADTWSLGANGSISYSLSRQFAATNNPGAPITVEGTVSRAWPVEFLISPADLRWSP